uniref:SWIM-type domain-containing protein n=1 Tax=Trichogramma kaykai TaxID=54128 RepID=A0ABD2W2Z6_9HYME
MARRQPQGICYVCNGQFVLRLMPYLRGDDNEEVREIAINRRDAFGGDPQIINGNTRICANCYQSIREEVRLLQVNPGCMKLNVLWQTRNNTCFICNARANVHRLSIECKVDVYIQCDIFFPETVRSCVEHLDHRGFILRPLMAGLRSFHRAIDVPGQYMQRFMQAIRTSSYNNKRIDDIYDLSDEEVYNLTSLTKEQFNVLYTYCDRVPTRSITRRDLLLFLCKMRQGVSDEFLTTIFQCNSRRSTSLIIASVRQSLMQRFVPQSIGVNAITREQYVARHVTAFSNTLYNETPEVPVPILYVDGTYTYCHKSTNFRSLRQTFCRHKSQHLVKPALVVAPDGYILDIQGPYFSDAPNNDAAMLARELENNEAFEQWLRPGDIFIVDRGYRDVVPILEERGIICKMPPLLEAGEHQLSTEAANEARLITKTRWIVEARNGHLKTIFKYLGNRQHIHVLPNIGDFYRIAGAIINRFHPPIHMQSADVPFAQNMLHRSTLINYVQIRVEREGLLQRNVHRWLRLNVNQVNDFPILDENYLENLTAGVFQLELAPSYIQDTLQRDEQEEIQVELLCDEEQIPEPGFLRSRIWSRYRNRTRYQQFIHFVPAADEENHPIAGYYCTCRTGARTLGTCVHIASILWYLGYARILRNVHFPSQNLIRLIDDAAERPPQINPL